MEELIWSVIEKKKKKKKEKRLAWMWMFIRLSATIFLLELDSASGIILKISCVFLGGFFAFWVVVVSIPQ